MPLVGVQPSQRKEEIFPDVPEDLVDIVLLEVEGQLPAIFDRCWGEEAVVVFEVGVAEVQEHAGSVKAIPVPADGPIVLILIVEPQQVGSEFLVRVLVDEASKRADGLDPGCFWCDGEGLAKIYAHQ